MATTPAVVKMTVKIEGLEALRELVERLERVAVKADANRINSTEELRAATRLCDPENRA